MGNYVNKYDKLWHCVISIFDWTWYIYFVVELFAAFLKKNIKNTFLLFYYCIFINFFLSKCINRSYQ